MDFFPELFAVYICENIHINMLKQQQQQQNAADSLPQNQHQLKVILREALQD